MLNVEDGISKVNSYMKELLSVDLDVYRAAMHMVGAGGKRLRPTITILTYGSLGGNTEDIVPAAASVELVHNFTLIHDDIIDKDDFRRGVPTVHRVYGEGLAILAGDLLFAKAFEALASSRPLINDKVKFYMAANALTRALVELSEGQNLDMENVKAFDEARYYELIEKKTSSLFKAAALIGVYAAGAYGLEQAAFEFGKHYGYIFQITDDLLGLVGDSSVTKKPVGSDLREGKRTLPIEVALRMADEGLKRRMLEVYGKPASQELVESVVNDIRRLGVDIEIKKIINAHAAKAREALMAFPDTPERGELLKMVEQTVVRRS